MRASWPATLSIQGNQCGGRRRAKVISGNQPAQGHQRRAKPHKEGVIRQRRRVRRRSGEKKVSQLRRHIRPNAERLVDPAKDLGGPVHIGGAELHALGQGLQADGLDLLVPGLLGLQAQQRQEVGQGVVGGVGHGLVLGAVEVVHQVGEEHQQQRPEHHLDCVGRPVEVPDAGSASRHEARAWCRPRRAGTCHSGRVLHRHAGRQAGRHACMHACMHACTHARMHACTHARMHAYTFARMHACTQCTHAYNQQPCDGK